MIEVRLLPVSNAEDYTETFALTDISIPPNGGPANLANLHCAVTIWNPISGRLIQGDTVSGNVQLGTVAPSAGLIVLFFPASIMGQLPAGEYQVDLILDNSPQAPAQLWTMEPIRGYLPVISGLPVLLTGNFSGFDYGQ